MATAYQYLKEAVETVTGSSSQTGDRLNRGQLELAKKLNRTKTVYLDAVNGTFALPVECLEIQSIGWNGEKLELYEDDILPGYGPGTPKFWKQDGDNIKLIPSATGQVQLVYKPRPATMTQDADVPELADCEDAIIAFAIWKNYVDGEDEEEADFWENEYYKRRQEWFELAQPKYKRKHRVKAGAYM